jgi:formylglycine-generating enzyme required for sulfatase activity
MGMEKISLPSEQQSGWTLADFDTQNPDPAPINPSSSFSPPEKPHPSLSVPLIEDAWAQDTAGILPSAPSQPFDGQTSLVESAPAGGLSVLNRPPSSALDHLRKISATKVDLRAIPSRSTTLETSTPVSHSTEIRHQTDYEARSVSQPSTLNSSANAILYGDAAAHKQQGIHWKSIIITVCIISGLAGAGLLGYEYFKIAQEQQQRQEAKKQQEQQDIARLTQEENRRREADAAERIQKIRDQIANKSMLAAELGLDQMAEAYPDHPSLATLRAEMANAENQGAMVKTQTENKTGIKLVWVPSGCFNMGSSASEQDRNSDELSHQVCVKGFWLGATEVTNGQYHRYKPDHDSGSFQSRPLNQDTQPVVNVNWAAAKAFTEWLSWEAGSGKRFRLPTEAEWEYATRASAPTRYFWGNTIDPRYANFSDRNDPSGASLKTLDDGQAVTAPVGRYLPNSFGLRDMSGNIWEWTCSEYDSKYGGQEQGCSDKGPNEGQRVARGGAWNNGSGDLRSAKRSPRKPEQSDSYTGFRVLMEE